MTTGSRQRARGPRQACAALGARSCHRGGVPSPSTDGVPRPAVQGLRQQVVVVGGDRHAGGTGGQVGPGRSAQGQCGHAHCFLTVSRHSHGTDDPPLCPQRRRWRLPQRARPSPEAGKTVGGGLLPNRSVPEPATHRPRGNSYIQEGLLLSLNLKEKGPFFFGV